MRRRAVSLAGLLLFAVACDSVSSENIQQWRNTEKGPRKLEAALKDSAVPANLRAEAAVVMVEMGNGDQVDAAVAGMAPADRAAVVGQLIPKYAEILEKGAPTKARDARDGLFGLRPHASPEDQKKIDAVLLPAIEKDLRAGRAAGGRHSIDKILVTIGPAAAPMLLQVLEDPAAPYMTPVEVLAKIGDPATRDKAGAALVKRIGQTPQVPVALWRAIGQMGGKTATAFLQEKVEKGHETDAVAAAQALQQAPSDPTLVAFAMRIAGDGRANKAVRDEMFGLLEHAGGNEARDGAIRIVASDPEEMVRYRAYEAALAIGKGDAIVPALEALPAKAAYKREDVVDFLVKDIQKVGPANAKPALLQALSSASPVARMTAVLALETMGAAADAAAVQKLSGDKASLKGFPAGSTVGKEAARVADVLSKSKKGGA